MLRSPLVEYESIHPLRSVHPADPDVAWLLAGDGGETHLYAAGDRLPIGIEAFPGRKQNDLVLWIESRRAVVAGDALVDFGRGLEMPQESLTKSVTREQVVEGLRPLLALPVEVVLPAHEAPTNRAALERALLTADVHPVACASVFSPDQT